MAKTVNRSVFVYGAEQGEVDQWFHPGDKLPGWAESILDPNVIATGKEAKELISEADDEQATSEVPEFDAPDYHGYSKAELVEACEERGLPSDGTMQVLIGRLEDSDAAVG